MAVGGAVAFLEAVRAWIWLETCPKGFPFPEDFQLVALEADQGPARVDELAEEVGLDASLGLDLVEEFVLVNVETACSSGRNIEV